MSQRGYRSQRRAKRVPDEFPHGMWQKIGFSIFEKVVLAVLAAVLIAFYQNRLQSSEKRIERARRIGEILVDKPVSIAGELPAHLDAFILYADHIRSANIKSISSEHLTELWAAIRSDIDGSRAYYSDDRALKLLGSRIKDTVTAVRATAMVQNSLQSGDLRDLEEARNLGYKFQRRVIRLSVQQELKLFDADYKQK
jgi:hypothetical protein